MAERPGVLVVDQDPEARFQTQQLVRQAEFVVKGQAALGTEAVAIAVELKPDIVLCGLKEPIVRVTQTIESLVHALPETPVVVYSESDDLEAIRKAVLAGARDFLRAPLKPKDLGRSLGAILEWEERRQLRKANGAILGPEGAVITVFGAKGGVGKTTVAANLAVALVQRAGQTVVLVDADDSFGDVAATLAVTPEQTITDSLRNLDGQDSDVLKRTLVTHESGVSVISAPVTPFEWKGLSGEQLQKLLVRLARQFDIVLVDTGATLGEMSQAALEAASIVLWVTTPEYASVRDTLQAFQAIGVLKLADERIRVVLNVVSPEIEVRSSSIEDALGRKIFWTVPYDRLLRRSAQAGRPVFEAHPESPAATNLADLAKTLSGMRTEAVSGGLLRRLLPTRRARRDRRELAQVHEEATP